MRQFNLIFFLLINLSALIAQGPGELLIQNKEESLIIKEWSTSQGLISNSVRKIGQTKEGFLLILTYNGISLFDGKNFENHTTENTPALKTNNIYDFCVDKDSIFWIATYRGVISYDGYNFYVPEKLKAIENLSVQTIEVDKENNLWIGTISDGLYCYRNNKLTKVTEIPDIDNSIVSLLFSDKEGNIWIGTELGDLYKYDGKKYHSIFHNDVSNGILAAVQNKNGRYFFGTRNGLYSCKNDTVTLITEEINFINDIREDKNSLLWIATNTGLYYYNIEDEQLFSISKENFEKQIIQTIYFDNDDFIWIGTYRKGLQQLRMGAFQNYPLSNYNINEVPSALVQINEKTIWIGTDEGKIFELKDGVYTKIKLRSNLKNSRIKSIFKDSKGNKWVCSYNGLLKIKNGSEVLLNNSSGFPDNSIRGIVECNDNTYWVGTRQSGLYQISEKLEIINTLNTSNGLSSNYVMSLVKDNKGLLYVATKSGIDVINKGKITKNYSKKNGLAEDMVFNVYIDKEGLIWAATIGGLSMIKEDKIVSFKKKDGLVIEKVFDIIEDDIGQFWLPSPGGILKVNRASLINYSQGKKDKIISFVLDKSDGMFDQQYVSASKALKLNNGEIAFNTLTAISVLNPSIANSVKSTQSLLIKSISTESNKFEKLKKKTIIPSLSKYLQIDFTCIDFINPDKIDFYYKLEPFDLGWQHTSLQRFARYTNLSPGEYSFTVKAVIKSQGGKELYKTIKFEILPTFYESIWFRIIAVITTIFTVWLLYIMRVRTIKRQKEHLENEVADRTAKISQQKEAIEKNLKILEVQKEEIAEKNEEILVARNNIEQAYINLKLLSDLGKEITSSLSEEEIVMTIYQNISTIMESDIVAFGNLNKEEGIISFDSIIYKAKRSKPINKPLDDPESILSYSINKNTAIISNNFIQDYPGFNDIFPEMNKLKTISSAIIFPINTKKGLSAILTTLSYRTNSYSDYHFNLMQNLAVYVGIAIENTRAYQKIQVQKEELQKVNQAKDKMFSIIGHDLRSPVGTIKSFLDVVIENPEMTNSSNVLQIFKTMRESLGSAYALLDNLLLWARNQRGQIVYQPANFDISNSIKESINLVEDSAKVKEITISSKIDNHKEVFADKNMITTVLRNLISNAIKFTNKKGKIDVVTELKNKSTEDGQNQHLEISVIDNGIGISKENINKIVQTNEIFSTPGTFKEQGSGLGIGICIDFLKKHGSKLIVENNMDKNNQPGTTFKFSIQTNK